MTQYSLAHLTVIHASPPELIRIAGAASYDMVGLRLLEVVGGDAWPLATDAQLMRDTKAEMAAYGVGVLDIELAKLQPETRIGDFRPACAAAAELGAKHVLTQAHDTDWSRLVDNFGAFCELISDFGLTADVEFLTWTSMRGVHEVMELLRASGGSNKGMVIDSLHFFRSGCTPADVRLIPTEYLHYIQLADAPAEAPTNREGLIFAAREARFNPGSGALDLVGLLRELPDDITIAIEIPNSLLAQRMKPEERARQALRATKKLVRQASAGTHS